MPDGAGAHGRVVQVDPIQPKLKPPGTKCLKLKCDVLPSTSGFKFNMRRYTMELLVQMPIVHFKPTDGKKKGGKGMYQCPLYMYPVRTGRALHSFPVPLNLSLLCPVPLFLS